MSNISKMLVGHIPEIHINIILYTTDQLFEEFFKLPERPLYNICTNPILNGIILRWSRKKFFKNARRKLRYLK